MATPVDRISEQTILEKVFDEDYNVLRTSPYGTSGDNLNRAISNTIQIYAVNSGGYDYFCFSAPGIALATAKWQVFRLDGSGNLMYADANAAFDNVATDPTLLDYAYS